MKNKKINSFYRNNKQRIKNWEKIWVITMLCWLLTCVYFVMTKPDIGEYNDSWWHQGYKDCQAQNNYSYELPPINITGKCMTYKITCLKGETKNGN